MAFVVETGDGLPNSNSYASVAAFVEYHTDRGRSLIDPTTDLQYVDALIEPALVLASDYVDTKFIFVGYRYQLNQNMEWPRNNAFYRDGRIADLVPKEVAECTMELAYKQLTGTELAPDPLLDDTNRQVVMKKEKVGPIEEVTQYTDHQTSNLWKAYPFAERRLKELLLQGQSVQRV